MIRLDLSMEEDEGCNETTLPRGRTRHNGGTSATRPQSDCEYHLFRRETSPKEEEEEEEEEDNLGLSFPLGIYAARPYFALPALATGRATRGGMWAQRLRRGREGVELVSVYLLPWETKEARWCIVQELPS